MLKVLKGSDDWLFLDNDRNQVIDQIQGNFPASKMNWGKIAAELRERIELSVLYGFRYLHLIAPNTHIFAKEYLPPDITVSEDRAAVYMQEHFPEVVFYPIELLRSQKDRYTLYHKTDTHWTELGVILVFNEISDRLGLDTKIDLDGEYETRVMRRGDLGTKLSPTKISIYEHLMYDYDVELISTNYVSNTGAYKHLRSKNRNHKRAVIFGDSYINAGLEQIAYYFEETFFFWQANIFDLNIVEQLRPDIVINETAERFFNGKFIQKRRYYHVLLDKIMALDSQKLNRVDLSDDFYDSSIQKWLAQYRKSRELLESYERLEEVHVDWGQKFHELTKTFKWLKSNQLFSGDKASREVGYHFLYPLCRILEECQPKDVLEFNFGQTTKIVAQYASAHGMQHTVFESRRERADFYLDAWEVPCDGTTIYISPIIQITWNEKLCGCFKSSRLVVEGKKYDLILMKRPLGGDICTHVDVLENVPDILNRDFVILMDYSEDEVEKMILHDIEEKLIQKGISFEKKDFVFQGRCVSCLFTKKWKCIAEY